MIKSLIAYTHEIDEPKKAVAELLEQLDLDNNLLKNSVGIVSANSEFLESGILTELKESLPFPFIGTTSLYTSTNGEFGIYMLGIMVLTSDDVSFGTAISESVLGELEGPIEAAYKKAAGVHLEAPSLVFTVSPLIQTYAGDQYVEVIDKLCGGAPVFGTLSVDHTIDYATYQVFMGDTYGQDLVALILLYGEVTQEFYVVGLSQSNAQKQMAIITKSASNILLEVNNMPVVKYLETLGLAEDGVISGGLNSVPLIIDYNDGTTPVTRAMFAATPEGYAVCGGIMTEGATLAIAVNTKTDVLAQTEELTKKIAASDYGTVIVFSCVGRNYALGADNEAEFESIRDILGGSGKNYLACYSGGEICPVYGDSGTKNRFHNITFTALAIK